MEEGKCGEKKVVYKKYQTFAFYKVIVYVSYFYTYRGEKGP